MAMAMAREEVELPREMRRLRLEEVSASRGACQICITSFAPKLKSFVPKEKSASHVMAAHAAASGATCKGCGAKMAAAPSLIEEYKAKIKAANRVEDSEYRPAFNVVACKVCVALDEDAGCPTCVAKAAALRRIEAAGGDPKEKRKPSPAGLVNAAELEKLLAAGGRVIKSAPKDGEANPIVTVKLPDSSVQSFMTPRKPLRPLSDNFFEECPSLREPTLACAKDTLWTIEREEDILEQYVTRGCATVDLEFED